MRIDLWRYNILISGGLPISTSKIFLFFFLSTFSVMCHCGLKQIQKFCRDVFALTAPWN